MRIGIPSQLNHETFEQVIGHIRRFGGTRAVLDLGNLSFIEPYGLVGLVSIVRYLSEMGVHIAILPPKWSVQSYLKRMGVYTAIAEFAPAVIPSRSLLPSRVRPLLEVTKVDLTNGFDEFLQIGNLLYERMDMMFSGDHTYSPTIIADLITSIIEVCQNIEHSKTYGYVAAQKYPGWKNAVKVGVMDLGIGISASLKPKYKVSGHKWSDRKALSLAIQPAYTARPSGSGGLGLVKVRNFIKDHPGCDFALRSGTAKYIIAENGHEQFVGGLQFFPGTQVSMTIRPCG